MKRFKTISTSFIIVIAIIFGCNLYYLVSLYNSIRESVKSEVLAAIADTDIDEMWERTERVHRAAASARASGENVGTREISVQGNLENGELTIESRTNDSVSVNKTDIRRDRSYSNQMINDMSHQMHQNIDPLIPFEIAITDSIMRERLADRGIYPDFLSIEIVDSKGKIFVGNPNTPDDIGAYDTFTLCFNPSRDMYYKLYISPLISHILSKMLGVIITIFLLMIAFLLAFRYLFHTVSKLRTIEEMKDDFVSNMTHELKTPIAIAYSANDALLNYDTDNDPAKKEKYLTIANKQLKRLGELVENILAMSMERRKTMKLKPEVIRLQPFIEEIAVAQRMRNDKEIVINVNVAEDISVDADKIYFANVLNNLIDNAIKYSGNSVEISITGDDKKISIADNGIGIPSKSIPYLFNKFYRVPHGNRQDVRGYGIGLYYVKSIVDKMGWEIAVKSKDGEGSVFTIRFGKDER